MSLGLLFPGQGTQHAGMLPWLAHGAQPNQALAAMEAVVGVDWRGRLEDRAWCNRNAVAQPLLTGLCLAAWEVLAPLLPAPSVIAGYSVGELAAFSAAGVVGSAVALQLAPLRAQLMDDCAQGRDTGLLALSGAAPAWVDALCRQHGLVVAIRIGPDRCVLGGPGQTLDAAARQAESAGLSCTRLAVAIASHTAWLADAALRFATVLERVDFAPPRAALVCNHGASVLRRAGDLRRALAGQIASPLRWDQCMDTLAERQPACVLEVGPGSTLARMWTSRHPGIPARSLDDFQSPAAVADWVVRTLARI